MMDDGALAVIPARGGSKGLPGKNTTSPTHWVDLLEIADRHRRQVVILNPNTSRKGQQDRHKDRLGEQE